MRCKSYIYGMKQNVTDESSTCPVPDDPVTRSGIQVWFNYRNTSIYE